VKHDSVLIVGVGALATLFASRLASAGIPVNLLGTWKEGIAALNEKGAQIQGEGAFPVHASNDPAEFTGTQLALILVKSWQTERAARQLSLCLAQDGLALTVQNGLGNDVILASTLDRERVARGVTTLGATLVSPGMVRMFGAASVTLERVPQVSLVRTALHRAGFKVDVKGNFEMQVWSKLVVNSAINPLTALLRVRNGSLLEIPSARKLMGELATETSNVAAALRVKLPFHDPVTAVEDVARFTGGNLFSMLQDIIRGGPTEIDAINGAIIHLAEANNVQVSVNQTVSSLVDAIPLHGMIMDTAETTVPK